MARPHKAKVEITEVGGGNGLMFAPSRDADLDSVPNLLDEAVQAWLRDNPRRRVRTTLPIMANYRTVRVFLWYDE